ncbi:MAG TPA: MerR family transcriptional regulator [Gemmatimonadaceae bacterium]|nr:MerR family transcriptional regulator [Gemmatimonadaceae bacterium]
MALSIGQVAAAADVNIQTIRYYERRGILVPASRTPAGYRKYGDDAVSRLQFIRHAQALGFTLGEIDELLALRVRDAGACRHVEKRTREKIDDVDLRIRELRKIKRTLERLAATCESRRTTNACPILEALEDNADFGR